MARQLNGFTRSVRVPIGNADLVALDMIGWDYEPVVPSVFQAGDADQDLDFDQFDLVMVLNRSKYLTGEPATWGDGDWNGTQAGTNGDRPQGDGVFDRLDIVAALATGNYLQGPYFQPENTTTRLALQAWAAKATEGDETVVSSSGSPALLRTAAPWPSPSGLAVAVSEPACGPMALSLVLLVFMTRRIYPMALGR